MITHRTQYVSHRDATDGHSRVIDSWYAFGVILLYRRQRFA